MAPRRHRAPIAVREEGLLPIGPAEAYDLAADLGHLAEWDPVVEVSELVRGERLTPGARYRATVRYLGLRGVMEYELLETVGAALTVYRGAAPGVESIEITPAPGGCRIAFSTDVTPLGWLLVPRSLVVLFLRRHATRSLAALQVYATALAEPG